MNKKENLHAEIEHRFAKETGIHKQKAADKINKNALLKADVRRLEKVEDNG